MRADSKETTNRRDKKMHKLFANSPFFDFEAVRILGECVYGGGEICEVLEAVDEIKNEDPERWRAAWASLASRAEQRASAALQRSDRVTARREFLAASNYNRASGHMLVGSSRHPHPQALTIHEKTAALFTQAVALSDGPVHKLAILFEDLKLPAFLHLPPRHRKLSGRSTPLIINVGGADSIQEELFFMLPAAGPELGYAVLTFDGPGQGLPLRKQASRMRPDFEAVTSTVLDFISDYSVAYPELDLDLDNVGIAGASMGGYYALRGAMDPRIHACAAIDPFYSMWDFGTSHISPSFMRLWTGGWIPDSLVDAMVRGSGYFSFQMRWELSTAGQFLGTDSPCSMLRRMKDFSLDTSSGKSLLSRVRCPVFVSGAASSLYLSVEAHTMRVFHALSHLSPEDRELWIPQTEGEGAVQAKMGALTLVNERVFAFFDRKFNINRATPQAATESS